ncbi:MAG: 4Fe-4S dicluster domain-containing protein [Candidatus Eremiobacteraeota bacterium]|nr:4Fe-4S dicluster domain-containing protein [Candidatus Eremiobacteraeota bacterium]
MQVENVISGPDLQERFWKAIKEFPEGEKFKLCIQCGTCGGSCPSTDAMEYTPREIFGMLRAGYIEKALMANTIWNCASCYLCTVRCPAGIKITDTMYALKSFAVKEGLYDKKLNAPVMTKAFVGNLERYGRSYEIELLIRYYLGTNPLGLIGQSPLGAALFFKGRLPLLPTKIKGIDQLQKIIKAINEMSENGKGDDK